MRGQCQLLDKNHQYFQLFSLPTDSVIVDHAVVKLSVQLGYVFSKFEAINSVKI
jgi:hypothetical protein